MKTKPNEKNCNYAAHNAADPFVKSELGKYFLNEEGEVVVLVKPENIKARLIELVATTCLSCGDRWYVKIT